MSVPLNDNVNEDEYGDDDDDDDDEYLWKSYCDQNWHTHDMPPWWLGYSWDSQ